MHLFLGSEGGSASDRNYTKAGSWESTAAATLFQDSKKNDSGDSQLGAGDRGRGCYLGDKLSENKQK